LKTFKSDRKTKSNGLMLLEHHSQKPNHFCSLIPKS
jgi:hypothetical protein